MDKSSVSSREEGKDMKNVSEYDERQLILMLEHLNSFENKQIVAA